MIRTKRSIAVSKTRQHLEPGPIVLISSAWKGKTNIMTLGWHGMIAYEQVITYIWDANHSFEMTRQSGECVINVPTVDMLDTVVAIGNCHGKRIDKFTKFDLTAAEAAEVNVPLIAECYASFECQLSDDSLIEERGLFIWDVVKAHVAPTPKNPRTIHYRGGGHFMIAGKAVDMRRKFKRGNL